MEFVGTDGRLRLSMNTRQVKYLLLMELHFKLENQEGVELITFGYQSFLAV